MRVVTLGGTRFVGRAIVERLAERHDVLIVHRGHHEPPDLPHVRHVHVDRMELAERREELAGFAADALVDVSGMNAVHARTAIDVLGRELRMVAISSADVYRAYAALHRGAAVEPVPLTEQSPRRGPEHWHIDRPDWENVEFEDVYLAAGATVLRLGAVYGPHDNQRRLEFVLRRMRAGRTQIPIGPGSFLFSRVYVDDVARAVERALVADGVAGQAFNICESDTWSYHEFAQRVIDAAGGGVELVTVADSLLPGDLLITAALRQDFLLDGSLGRRVLQWEETDRIEALHRTVEWDLDHPPADPDLDFGPDDLALATVAGT